MLPHSPYLLDLAPCNFHLLPFMKKKLQDAVSCHQKMWKQHRRKPCGRFRKMVSSIASRSYTKDGKSVLLSKVFTLKVGVLQWCELFWVKNFTLCLQTFGSYFVYLTKIRRFSKNSLFFIYLFWIYSSLVLPLGVWNRRLQRSGISENCVLFKKK